MICDKLNILVYVDAHGITGLPVFTLKTQLTKIVKQLKQFTSCVGFSPSNRNH
jgi:hypothetical protein